MELVEKGGRKKYCDPLIYHVRGRKEGRKHTCLPLVDHVEVSLLNDDAVVEVPRHQ